MGNLYRDMGPGRPYCDMKSLSRQKALKSLSRQKNTRKPVAIENSLSRQNSSIAPARVPCNDTSSMLRHGPWSRHRAKKGTPVMTLVDQSQPEPCRDTMILSRDRAMCLCHARALSCRERVLAIRAGLSCTWPMHPVTTKDSLLRHRAQEALSRHKA